MTAEEFMRWAAQFYGRWEVADRKAAVWEYVRDLSPSLLDRLRMALRRNRAPEAGPLSVPALRVEMEHLPPGPLPPLLEDGPSVTRQEIADAMAPVLAKMHEQRERERLTGADYYLLKRPKPFAHLDGLRYDERVELCAEYYDETISIQERMESYVARYRPQNGKRG